MARVDQQGHAAAGLRDGFVHFPRVPVSPASLDVAMQKMVSHSIQDRLRRLRTGRIVKENEIILQGGKRGANLLDGKLCHGPNDYTGQRFSYRQDTKDEPLVASEAAG